MSKIFSPKSPKLPPPPAPVPVVPMVDAESLRKKRKAAIDAIKQRTGRQSTILSEPEDTMG